MANGIIKAYTLAFKIRAIDKYINAHISGYAEAETKRKFASTIGVNYRTFLAWLKKEDDLREAFRTASRSQKQKARQRKQKQGIHI